MNDTPDLVTRLVKLVADLTWFLECCSDDEVDPAWAVRWLEHIGTVFDDLSQGQRERVIAELAALAAADDSPAGREWLENFPKALGLIEMQD